MKTSLINRIPLTYQAPISFLVVTSPVKTTANIYDFQLQSLFHQARACNYQICPNSCGQWLIKMPNLSQKDCKTWILQQVNSHKWLITIDNVPQFFLSTKNVLNLLKNLNKQHYYNLI